MKAYNIHDINREKKALTEIVTAFDEWDDLLDRLAEKHNTTVEDLLSLCTDMTIRDIIDHPVLFMQLDMETRIVGMKT